MKSFLAVLLFFFSLDFATAATITVTNTHDSGPGSLRQALADAADGDTINFDLPYPAVIRLASGALDIGNVTVSGPGAQNLKIERDLSADMVFEILHVFSDSVATITGITISGGDGDDAGGIYNEGALTLRNSAVSNNTAYDFAAGAGGIENAGSLTAVNCTIANNLTLYAPAGIENERGATLTLTSCTISSNKVDTDKANLHTLPDPPVMAGGGIFIDGGQVTITSSTIANNLDPSGGGDGIFVNAGRLTLKNTIIADNGSEDLNGAAVSLGYNLIGNGDSATITPAKGDQIGTTASPIDPMLGLLRNNGGPTYTHALLDGSPAIDKGKSFGLTTDQRGFFRPVEVPGIPPAPGGDNSDIGAYEKQAARPLNLSTRAKVLTGDKILDAGFIITGSEAKRIIVRGLGPSLGQQGISGFLADPVLELHDSSGAILAMNDNWKDSQEDQIKATGLAPKKDAESAIVETLDPGSYTAILSGKSNGTGIGLVEIYDLNQGAVSSFDNASTRGFVGTQDDVMISGFILGAGQDIDDRILVRGLGPSLQPAVAGVLADPALELHDANGTLIASDDDWQDTQAQAIKATGLAPQNPKEAAILEALPAGAYTTVVRGQNQTTGIALLEIYNLH